MGATGAADATLEEAVETAREEDNDAQQGEPLETPRKIEQETVADASDAALEGACEAEPMSWAERSAHPGASPVGCVTLPTPEDDSASVEDLAALDGGEASTAQEEG